MPADYDNGARLDDRRYVDVEAVQRAIDAGYHDRDDYPPYALMSWEDRSRYREYVFRVMNELAVPLTDIVKGNV